jgi:hypothetical protein
MEDIVDPCARGELEPNSHVVDDLLDAVGPHIAGFELARCRTRQ